MAVSYMRGSESQMLRTFNGSMGTTFGATADLFNKDIAMQSSRKPSLGGILKNSNER